MKNRKNFEENVLRHLSLLCSFNFFLFGTSSSFLFVRCLIVPGYLGLPNLLS